MNPFVRAIFAAVFCFTCVAPLSAQEYPSKVVRLVVPYPPGGVVDITGRLLADQLGRELAGTVIVENRPGAGGTVGANSVARSAADGYTILLSGAATHAFAQSMYKNLPYDPVKDFVPVTQVTEGPLALCVNSASPATDIRGLVALLKSKGAAANYASNGIGTYPHLSVEFLKQATGLQTVHVAYKGGGQAVTALLAGEVDLSQNHIPVVAPHVRSGKLRVIASTGESRSGAFPEVPTLREAGIDVVASAWFGVFAPAGTPRTVVNRLHAAIAAAAANPGLKEKLAAQGDEVRVEGPDRFAAYQKSELAKWSAVIGKAGIKAE
jgi:tripartite-type tricarboxylate transporter receptor subunit TctC